MKSFVSKHVFDQIRPLPVISKSTSSCISITGEPLKIEGTIHTQLSFPCNGSAPYSGSFLVSSHLFQQLQCILGWDFLTRNSLQLSYAESGGYSIVGAHGITPLSPHNSLAPCPLHHLPCLVGVHQPTLMQPHPVYSFSLQLRALFLSSCSQIFVFQIGLKLWSVVVFQKVVKGS